MDKHIKTSKRGLTFSFDGIGKFNVGSKYRYLIDKATHSIKILPAEDGRHTVSRKFFRRGKEKALIDLRSQEVRDFLTEAKELEISISGDSILVKDTAREKTRILAFPRSQLAEMRRASGISSAEAAAAMVGQVSLDEYLSSVNIGTVHKDLADVFTVVSLFSGAGILDWPFFNDPKFEIKYAIDYDEAACETYRHNIGMHIVHGDIHKSFTPNGYTQDSLVDSPVDIVIGGPSCKPFSNANRHTRLAAHRDSDLVMEYLRIVKQLQPKVFAMENVPSVLTACDGAYFKAIREVAEEYGYTVDSRIVEDASVGGFTTRRRAFVIGSKVGPVCFQAPLGLTERGRKTVRDAFARLNSTWTNLHDITLPGKETEKRMSFVPQGGNYKNIPEEFQTPSKNRHSCTYRRLALDEPSPTIVNWRKPPLIHPTENRTLSVAEAKALQGLPGEFTVLGSLGEMQQQVGNSVPVAMGKFLKNAILATLFGTAQQLQIV